VVGHGNSYHLSGSYASEVRHIVLHPTMCINDSGTCNIVSNPDSGSNVSDPMDAADVRRRFNLGVKVESGSMQMYITTTIPEGWRATAILVNYTHHVSGAQVSVPVCCVSRKIANIDQGSSTSDYFTEHLAFNTSNHTSNTKRAFGTS
jgi:hypothetical protein